MILRRALRSWLPLIGLLLVYVLPDGSCLSGLTSDGIGTSPLNDGSAGTWSPDGDTGSSPLNYGSVETWSPGGGTGSSPLNDGSAGIWSPGGVTGSSPLNYGSVGTWIPGGGIGSSQVGYVPGGTWNVGGSDINPTALESSFKGPINVVSVCCPPGSQTISSTCYPTVPGLLPQTVPAATQYTGLSNCQLMF